MDVILGLVVGVSLAASCGFRVFSPLLVCGLAGRFGGLPLADALAWSASTAGLVCLGAATLVELLAYYIPWVDNALDTISTPLAMAAGALVMGAQMEALPAFAQWGIAIVAGAGAAGGVQLTTASLRAASSATTGGLGNSVVATGENIMSIVGAVLAVVAPVLAFIGLCILGVIVWRLVRLMRRRRAAAVAS